MTGPRVLESDLQDQVIELAHVLGWVVLHIRPGRTVHGYRTPISADGKGWPDLFMARPRDGRLLAVELKSATGRPTPEQLEWLDVLRRCDVETHLWRPDDWNLIVETLT